MIPRDSFARAQVRDFIPVLVEREARARLEHPIWRVVHEPLRGCWRWHPHALKSSPVHS